VEENEEAKTVKKIINSGMANLFQKLEIEAFRAGITPRTKESRDWFRKKAAALGTINRNQLMKQEELDLTARQAIGSMYMFYYDPKHKDTLPYYDSFPLAVVIERAPGGFLGLNLHYLPPVLRAKFLDGLMDLSSDNSFDDNTFFKARYRMLKSSSKLKYFQPCVKHYLGKHVRSRFARVPAPEWEVATFLPMASWQKGKASQVYADSRKMGSQ